MENEDLLQKLSNENFTVNHILVQDFVGQILSLDFIDFIEIKKVYNKNYYVISAQNLKNIYTIIVLPSYQTMEYAVLKIQNKENKELVAEFSPHLEDDMIYETYRMKFDEIYSDYFDRKRIECNINNLFNFLEEHLMELCAEKSLSLNKTENSLKVFADNEIYLEFDLSRPSVLTINFDKLSKKLAIQSIMHRNLKKIENYYAFMGYIEDALDNLKVYKETGNILLLDKKTSLNEFLDFFTEYNLYPNVDYLSFRLSSVANLGSKSKYAIFSNLQYLYENVKINFELCIDGENYLLKTTINNLNYENNFDDVFQALKYIHQIKTNLENQYI